MGIQLPRIRSVSLRASASHQPRGRGILHTFPNRRSAEQDHHYEPSDYALTQQNLDKRRRVYRWISRITAPGFAGLLAFVIFEKALGMVGGVVAGFVAAGLGLLGVETVRIILRLPMGATEYRSQFGRTMDPHQDSPDHDEF